MKVFITGIAGYIGSNCAERFAELGYEVFGVDNFNDYYSPELKRRTASMLKSKFGIDVRSLDLKTDSILDMLEGVEAVIHFAAQPGISSTTTWKEYFDNNVMVTHRILQDALAADLPKFVNIATSSIYGLEATSSESVAPRPASIYGVSKLAAEQEALSLHRTAELSVCSIRPFSVYGERERPEKLFARLIKAAFQGSAFPLYEGAANHRRSFTYVGDLCQAIILALQNWEAAQGEIFNVGTETSTPTLEAIKAVETVVGKPIRIENRPPRPGDQSATHANIGKARKLLGWNPETTLEQGVESMVEWYEEEVFGKFDWA